MMARKRKKGLSERQRRILEVLDRFQVDRATHLPSAKFATRQDFLHLGRQLLPGAATRNGLSH